LSNFNEQTIPLQVFQQLSW